MFRSVDEFKSILQCLSLLWRMGLVKSPRAVCIQIVHEQRDLSRFRIAFGNLVEKMCPVVFRSTLSDLGDVSLMHAATPSHVNNNRNCRHHVKTGDGFIKRFITNKHLKNKLSGCSDITIWRLCRNGKLPLPKKLGNRNITPENEADKAIAVLIGV